MGPVEPIVAVAGAVHAGLAILAAALALAVTAAGAIAGFGRPIRRPRVDELIAILAVVVGAAVVVGVVLLAGRGLGDPLHVVYALVALAAAPAARILATPGQPLVDGHGVPVLGRGQGRWIAFSGLVTVGVLGRLAMTG